MSLVTISGCMFGSKTGRLLRMLHNLNSLSPKPRIVCLTPRVPGSPDPSLVESRDGTAPWPTQVFDPPELAQFVDQAQDSRLVLAISETQFIPERAFDPPAAIGQLVVAFANSRSSVLILEGLVRDSEGARMGPLGSIIAAYTGVGLCTHIQCVARCQMCGGEATETYYRGVKTVSVKVGNDGYEPRCSACWLIGQTLKVRA